jgi:hypothetical protein
MEGGGSACELKLAIVNSSPVIAVVVRGFRIELPWNDPDFAWLSDPSAVVPARDTYELPGITELPRSAVLNHRTYTNGTLRPGDVLQGTLFGRGPKPVPDDLRHGSTVNARVKVLDQDGNAHSTCCQFQVDRHLELSGRPYA